MAALEQDGLAAALRAAVCIMRIALEPAITRDGGRVEVRISAPAPAGSAPEYQEPVTGIITVSNAGGALTAQGQLHTKATVQCSRCARAHSVVVEVDVNEECVLEEIDQPQAHTPGESGTTPFPIRNGNEIDLSELVRQLLNLHLPLRSLCRPDCAGLCPNCGQDLNQGHCGCRPDEGDPRLSPLAELRPKLDQ